MVDGGHYMGLAGGLGGSKADAGLRYVLLTSFEGPLASLRAAQRALVWMQAVVILAGVVIIALVVGRVSRPLRDLRDTAEAVGRGDFSAAEWHQAVAQARDVAEPRGVRYLIETPLLGDLIEDGLDVLGYNITEEEMNRS